MIALQNKHYTFFVLYHKWFLMFYVCIYCLVFFSCFERERLRREDCVKFFCPEFMTIKLLAKIKFLLQDLCF